MIGVSFQIGDTGPILRQFKGAGPDVRLRIQSALELVGGELLALMKANASKLERRTGKLQRAFYHKVDVRNGGTLFVLTTGLNRRAFYGSFQDRGVPSKTVEVKGYTRGVKSRNVKEGRRRVASGVGFVNAYRRQMHLTAEPFIGVSLEEMRSTIVRELQLAVAGGLG